MGTVFGMHGGRIRVRDDYWRLSNAVRTERSTAVAVEEEQGRQGRLVARIARADSLRLRGDHPSDGYYPQNDALTIGGVRGRRLREEHRRGSRPRIGAGETGGVPRDGKTRREVPRPRVERVRGVVH